MSEPKLSLFTKVSVRLLGPSRIGEIKEEGWTGSMPLYAAKCKEHGYFTDYPHGWERELRCPECGRLA